MFHAWCRCSLVHSVSGAVSEIFPTGRLLRPHILLLPSMELLIGHDNLSSFVGEPCSPKPGQRDGMDGLKAYRLSRWLTVTQAAQPGQSCSSCVCLANREWSTSTQHIKLSATCLSACVCKKGLRSKLQRTAAGAIGVRHSHPCIASAEHVLSHMQHPMSVEFLASRGSALDQHLISLKSCRPSR